MSERFDKPVHVMLKTGKTFVIERPLRAAEALLHEWPTQGGSKHLAARKAVLKALENAQDGMLAAKARRAFEDAAAEAGVLMPAEVRPTGGRPSPKWRGKRKLKRDM